uniref:Putative LOV domain-containing protein n=1 Tax=Ginkgo biloba TaxID=3311 RepID=A0A126X1H0_GINBI|nr:putative LOV domain-containing protein [Ginkgo biloba]
MCSQLSGQPIDESLDKPYSVAVREALEQIECNFVITDPHLPDNPIVYASSGFLKMTGFTQGEVLGRNCRFLQGPHTNRRTVLEIGNAIREEKSCQVTILNYRKDGTYFWNLFHMAPLFSEDDGRVIHFVGVQTPIIEGFQLSGYINNATSRQLKGYPAYIGNGLFTHKSNGSASIGAVSNTILFFNSCRREMLPGALVDYGYPGLYNSFVGSNRGSEEQQTCEAKESDKQKGAISIRSVLSQLICFSKYTGKNVSDISCALADPFRGAHISSSLSIALTRIQQSLVLTNPYLPDMPIVYASDMFLELTGYSRDEVLGHNCRFLQGPGTDQAAVAQIRQSIEAEQICTVRILNYRKDQKPFWNLLHTAPVRDAFGKVAFYVGVQLDVTSIDLDENQDNDTIAHINQLGAIGAVRVAVRMQGARPSQEGGSK